MNIQELEKIMIEYGVVLRAIPMEIRHIVEKSHIDKYSQGRIEYVDKCKREMLVFETVPKNAGKFVFEYKQGTNGMVSFSGNQFFDSIEEAIQYLLENNQEVIQ